MHLILTGASGVVGSSVLAHILSLPAGQVTRLSVLARKPIPMLDEARNPAFKFIQHDDFSTYPPQLLQELKGAHGVVWALGVSQLDVSAEEYVKITKDYTLAAATAFSEAGGEDGKLNFVYVSGEGATLEPGRFTSLFGKVKGETEAALLELGKSTSGLNVFSLRPGAVDPAAQPEVYKVAAARIPFWKKCAWTVVLPAIRVGYKSMYSPTTELGMVLTQLAMGDGAKLEGKGIEGEGRTVTNAGFRKLAGI